MFGFPIEQAQKIGNGSFQVNSTDYFSTRPEGELTYPGGRHLTIDRDGLDRIKQIQDNADNAGNPLVEYNYVGTTRTLDRIYQNGTKMTFRDGSVDVGYDGDRRKVEMRDIRTSDGSLVTGFSYRYDRVDNRLSETFLHEQRIGNGETRASDSVVSPGNRTGDIYEYDSVSRIVSATYEADDAESSVQAPQSTEYETRTDYTIDGVNNWAGVKRTEGTYSDFGSDGDVTIDVGSTVNEMNEYEAYGDDASRVHDENGNLTDYAVPFATFPPSTSPGQGQGGPGGGPGNNPGQGNGPQTGPASLTGDGYMPLFSSNQSRKLVYDAFNRLVEVSIVTNGNEESVVTYDYYANNMRAQKTRPKNLDTPANPGQGQGNGSGNTPGQTHLIQYFYNGQQVVEEQVFSHPGSPSPQHLRTYVWGRYIDELCTMDTQSPNNGIPESRLFFHCNANYSIYAATNEDGAVVERVQYDVFGRPDFQAPSGKSLDRKESIIDNPYLFQGRRWDPESKLYYYRNRYYDAGKGRFITRDPMGIWYDAKQYGNGYASFSLNSPVFTDSYGFYTCPPKGPDKKKAKKIKDLDGDNKKDWKYPKADVIRWNRACTLYCLTNDGGEVFMVKCKGVWVHRCPYPGAENKWEYEGGFTITDERKVEPEIFVGESKVGWLRSIGRTDKTRYEYDPQTGVVTVKVYEDGEVIRKQSVKNPSDPSDLPWPGEVDPVNEGEEGVILFPPFDLAPELRRHDPEESVVPTS